MSVHESCRVDHAATENRNVSYAVIAHRYAGRTQDGERSAGLVDTVKLEKTETDVRVTYRREHRRHTFKREVIEEDDAKNEGHHKEEELAVVVHTNCQELSVMRI